MLNSNPAKAILFLSLLFVWAAIIILSAAILGLIPNQEQIQLLNLAKESVSAISYIKKLFSFADDWTWVNIIICYTLIIITFCIYDIILIKIAPQFKPSLSENMLYINGFIWLARISIDAIAVILTIIIVAYIVNVSTSDPLILNENQLKGKYSVLILGTSKYIKNTNTPNQYYIERIKTTVWLYKNGFTDHIIASGDHQNENYSEPIDIKNDLVRNGVPEHIIELDLTGFRTFDSIKKIKKSSNNPILIVSQKFHLERALYIAKKENYNTYGFVAKGSMTNKMVKREAFAKIKVLLDIHVLNTQAYGIQAQKRRKISFTNTNDLILLSFLAFAALLSGALTRQILTI